MAFGEIKRRWLGELAAQPTFQERCLLLCLWTQKIYNSPKVLFIFHSERKRRYSIHKAIGIHKSFLGKFDFFHTPFIYNDGSPENEVLFDGPVLFDKWMWFGETLKKNLHKSGLNGLLPLWSGNECIGAILLKLSSDNFSDETRAFAASAADFAHLMEIAFIQQLLYREMWEKKIVLDVGKKISEFKDLDSVLNLIIDSVREVIPYDAAGIFLLKMPEKTIEFATTRGYPHNMEKEIPLKIGKGLVGWVVQNEEEVIVPDVRVDTRYIMARRTTRSELAVPISYGGMIMGAIALESDRVDFFRYHHVELMRTFAAQTAIVLENSKLLLNTLQITRVQKELEIAYGIQQALLPKQLPSKKGYDFAAINITSQTIGGDLYDFVTLTDDELGIAIGDISGKGIPGAVLMASVCATFRGIVREASLPNVTMKKLNNALFHQTESNKFATFFYGILNPRMSSIRYTNAGHNPPVLYRQDNEWKELKLGGPLLGFIPDTVYRSGTVKLKSGDILFLYTDGISESLQGKRNEFGVEGIIASLKKSKHLSAEKILKRVLADVQKFTKRSQQDDDVTIVVVKKL